jgi:small subunit ribosomal protein S5
MTELNTAPNTENKAPTSPSTESRPQGNKDFRGPRPGGDRRFDRNRPGGFNNRRGPGGPGGFGGGAGGNRRGPGGFGGKRPRQDKKPREDEMSDLEIKVIEVKRVTRVVSGGKRMRFAALVVVGDKQGRVGYGFKKGLDYQDSVAKATRKARENLIKLDLNQAGSIKYPLTFKFKSAQIFLKPADSGTGLIAGGFLRPVLELAGVQNVYTKILGSRNKISGVQAALKALEKYNS